MITTHWSDALVALNACGEAVEWARTQPDADTAWRECERSDWMLWMLPAALGDEDARDVRLMACDFAEAALKHVPEGEDRPRKAIEVARRYARGDASDKDLAAAAAAAADDAEAAAAAAAAVDAADAAADAAAAAAAAVDAAVDAAAADADAVAVAARATQARAIRSYWPIMPDCIRARLTRGGEVDGE